jgi:peptidoglycan/LPS O-acetylase OafA/YrhL
MHRFLAMLGDSMLAPAALGIVYTAGQGVRGPIGRVLAWGPLVYLGKISYGLYVWHFFVPLMTAGMFRWVGLSMQDFVGHGGFFLLNGIVLIVLSSLSWHCFEKQINALKKYFPYVPRDRSCTTRA